MSDKIYITDAQVAGYSQITGVARNALCPLPKCARAEQPPILTQSQQSALAAALRPKRVTRAEALLDNDGLLMLLCAGRNGNAALIGRQDDKNVLVPVGGNDLTSTVLAYLLEGGEPNSAEASIRIKGDSFLLLLAVADTYRRRYLASLLNHQAQQTPLALDDLKKTIEDAYNESDTRWLFPFALMALEYPVIEDMQSALGGLYSGGMLKARGLALTDDGERLADELMYLQAAVHIQTKRARGDALMSEDVLLLRTRESLWCAIVGKAETMLFTLSAERLFELVNAICEELDEPREDTEILRTQTQYTAAQPPAGSWRCECGNVNTGRFCAGCGKPMPAQTTVTGGSWQCACGSVNRGGFCPKCGAKRSAVSAGAADGSWRCVCGRTNKGGFCPKCGAKRPY